MTCGVVIFDFGDLGKGDLYNFAVCTFHLDARCGEGLSGFHAAYHAAHALAVNRNNLNVVFAVKWLQGSQGFSYFHVLSSG